MAETALVIGGVPLLRERSDGRYIAPGSFKGIVSGKAPVCWRHWAEDNYIFKHAGAWFVVDDAVCFMHTLDLTRPQEMKVYEMAGQGLVKLSHGIHGTPTVTRTSVAIRERYGEPLKRTAPLKNETIGHWAYCLAPAFDQDPVSIVCTI